MVVRKTQTRVEKLRGYKSPQSCYICTIEFDKNVIATDESDSGDGASITSA